jgi:hypothetical protein
MGLLLIALLATRLWGILALSLSGVALLGSSIWATPLKLGAIAPTYPSSRDEGLLQGCALAAGAALLFVLACVVYLRRVEPHR